MDVSPRVDEERIRQDEGYVRSIARDVLRNEADVDDVAQEVWLAALEQPPHQVAHFRGWLRRVTRNAALRFAIREKRLDGREHHVARPDVVPSVLSHFDRQGAHLAAERLISRLEPPYCEVLRLAFLEDRTAREIAEILGSSPATVRSQLKRGLEQLRARVPEDRRRAWIGAPWLSALRRRLARRPLARAVVAAASAAVLALAVFLWSAEERGPAGAARTDAVVSVARDRGALEVERALAPAARDPVLAEPVVAPAPSASPPSASALAEPCTTGSASPMEARRSGPGRSTEGGRRASSAWPTRRGATRSICPPAPGGSGPSTRRDPATGVPTWRARRVRVSW
jgi:RNA polymerase sigma-70 factor (ECF subfamily)